MVRRQANKDHAGIRGGGGWVNVVLWEGVHTYLLLTVEVAHEVGRLMLIEWSEDKLTRIMQVSGVGVGGLMWYYGKGCIHTSS